MPDVYSKSRRSELMRGIRSQDTKPELAVRRALHGLGLRFRLHRRSLPGKPDLVLSKYKAAIQVRGCFWHSHTCKDGHVPKSGTEYWPAKLIANKERDARNDDALRQLGWNTIVVWECECASWGKLAATIARIVAALELPGKA